MLRRAIHATALLVFAQLCALSPALLRAQPDAAPLSPQTEECLDCHADYHPGLVADWRSSRHARVTPRQALDKPVLERRISISELPASIGEYVVGCYECHSLNPDNHADNFEHYDYRLNTVVSPPDCATCHPLEAEEYTGSKKAHAVDNLEENPLYHTLVETITSAAGVDDGGLVHLGSSVNAQKETCFACHGTRVEVKGLKEVDVGDDIVEVPNLTNWPNQGVGRINPDGSLGACTACHPRHSFSIEVARKPFTCAQCHLDPDVPAWNVYRESKHGNIMLSEQDEYDWDHVPWRVGEDFRAPTCATCHNSLVTSPGGEVIAERTHDFGARLWVRLFGLIYSHPQPVSGKTYTLRNPDGQPLPTTFAGELAAEGLIDAAEQERRRHGMGLICRSCHGTSWTQLFFAKLDSAIVDTDEMTAAATGLMQLGWERGLADPANPFDEPLEHMWIRQWLFYANSVRYAAAMAGPDYAAFKNGWWSMNENLAKMAKIVEGKSP